MKEVKETLLERRSIRRYERRAIEPEKMAFIYEAIRNTPTSYNGQQFSVVAVYDQAVKERLYEITGQKQAKTSAVFLLFCMDFHQLEVAAAEKGIEFPDLQNTVNGFTVGVVDAAMAMHSAVVAAEAQGLGSCCIGYVRTADAALISQIVGLPQKVGIVCGLAIGYPNETPDLKPKRPVKLVIHEDRYLPDGEIAGEIIRYDSEVTAYNTQRSGDKTSNDWVGHILEYHAKEAAKDIGAYYAGQGIKLK